MARKLKIMENEKLPLDDLKNDEITDKHEKLEMHTEAPGIWRENWNHEKWEIHTLGREIWQKKTEKGGKFRNLFCRTWNMARKLKNMENEKNPLDELKNDENTEKR